MAAHAKVLSFIEHQKKKTEQKALHENNPVRWSDMSEKARQQTILVRRREE